ncbi:uncharacterized protein [Bactrocera oleae]|uniref:uncharacterized protein n=1 Tax=Bactrocera oleae TaxID=104688 RepID=UPI00387E9A4C
MFNMSDSVKFLFYVVLCLVICDNTLGAQRKCAEYNEDHATSLPRASVTMPQAVESPSQPAAVGDEVSAAAAQLMQLLPANELPSRSTECGKFGDPCILADDCCTKHCHNYAKRCVT